MKPIIGTLILTSISIILIIVWEMRYNQNMNFGQIIQALGDLIK